MVLLEVLDMCTDLHPSVSLYVYIDDIDVGATGDEDEVVNQIAGATETLVDGLENTVLAIVSKSKSKVLGSSKAIRSRLSWRLSPLGIGVAVEGKKLGCDFTLGKQRVLKVSKMRLASTKRRTRRFLLLKRGAGRKKAAAIHKAGALPAATYGMAVLGASDSHLGVLRATHARVAGLDSQLGSQRLGFLLRAGTNADPAVAAHTLPMFAWSKIVWEETAQLEDLNLATAWALDRMRSSKAPWKRVVGPAGAVVTSLARLGWECLDAKTWRDDLGTTIDLTQVCPKAVSELIARGVTRWTWRAVAKEHTVLAHLEKGADLKPIIELLRQTESATWGSVEKTCLEAAVIGAAPSQEVLEKMDMVDDDLCKWCSDETGSYLHRHWRCEGSRGFREEYNLPEDIVEAAQDCRDPGELALFERGLYPDQRHMAARPLVELQVQWDKLPPGGLFQGRCYIDGAGLHPRDRILCRAGWGICQLDGDMRVAGKAHGNVPGEVQHAGLGELFAFYQLLVHCIPPVVAVTDYENLVTGLDAGKKVCTASGQKDAGAWKRIWDKVEDIGRENIQLIKVPAHKSRQDVLNGTAGISIRDWTGNAEADKAARAGARLHPSSEELRQQIKDGHDMAKMVCKWLGTLGGHLCKLGSPDVDARPQQHVRGLELVDIPRSSLTPTWHWKPRLLHKEEKKVRQQEVLPEVAEESPPAMVQQKHPHSSHCLREIVGAPRIIFCWTCGAYCGGGAKRVTQPSAKFQAVCKGHSGTLQAKLKRCRKGHHPTTNRYLGVVRRPFAGAGSGEAESSQLGAGVFRCG
jgi:hypothetical protein